MAYDRPHGIAVIVSNKNFTNVNLKREGAEFDEENLTKTFQFLGYNVEIHHDCKQDDTEDIFKDIAKSDKVKGHDSFVCCILSHGRDGEILASDDRPVRLDYITQKLRDCKHLHGKPKIFFIQACRGSKRDGKVDDFETEELNIPSEADFFFGFATPRDYVSWRNPKGGSGYIKALCNTFCKYGKCTSLVAMHVIINNEVSKQTIESKDDKGNEIEYKQIPEFQDRLRFFVFFFKQTWM